MKDVVIGEKQMKNVRQRMPEFPVVTGIIVTLIYIFVIVFGEITSIILSKSILDNNAVLTQLARILILLLLNCLMWFLFVPKILLLPSAEPNLSAYLSSINLGNDAFKDFRQYIFYAISSTTIFFVGVLTASALTGEYIFEISRIIGLPEDNDLKSFGFLFYLIPSIFEEIAFRGVILLLLLRKYSNNISIIISAFIFGIGHLINYLIFGNFWSSMTQIVTGIMIGVFFAYLVLRTSSLVPGIIIHYLYNSFVILFRVFNESDPQTSFYLQILFGCLLPIVINLILSRFLPLKKQETV